MSIFREVAQKLIPGDSFSILSILTRSCLRAALNDRLRDEIQQLKIATGQVNASIGKMGNFGVSSFGGNPQSYQRSHIQSLLAAQQLQQLQIHSQHQQQQQPAAPPAATDGARQWTAPGLYHPMVGLQSWDQQSLASAFSTASLPRPTNGTSTQVLPLT